MAEAAIAAKSRRETVMGHVWGRCNTAWIEGDFEQALCLDRLYTTLGGMTDVEYEAQYECDCPDCHCQD